jgi:prepilin-type N-terminal cleavage/methylation domain-containing protein
MGINRQRKTCSSRRGFTLLELLVVVGLMGLLLLFAVPSFQSVKGGANLRSAAFQLNTALSLARQTAISSRQEAYVLFPDDQINYTDSHVEYALRGYALYAENDGYMGNWRLLPPGVIIHPTATLGGAYENFFLRQYGGGDPMFSVDSVPFPAADDTRLPFMYAIGFRSDGPTHPGGIDNANSASVYLCAGFTDFDPRTGTFNEWGAIPDVPVTVIKLNAVTGQSSIREFAAADVL